MVWLAPQYCTVCPARHGAFAPDAYAKHGRHPPFHASVFGAHAKGHPRAALATVV